MPLTSLRPLDRVDRQPPRATRPVTRRLLLSLVVGSAFAAAGCHGRGLPDTVAVQGRVTFAGGECPQPGHVFFVPESAGVSGPAAPRAGSGRFDRDGRFSVTTLVPDDGLVPGAYAVRVVCELPAEDDEGRGRSFVPAGFSAPGLTVPARAAGPVTYEVDVPLASAAARRGREAP